MNQPNMVCFTWKFSFALLLLLFVFTFHGGVCSGSKRIRCHERDRRLMQIFKQGVDDSSNSLSWSGEDCCEWAGVECDNITGRVAILDLVGWDLKGEINLSALLELEFLNYLDLSSNQFEAVRYHNQSLVTSHLDANFSSSLSYLDLSFEHDHCLKMDNLDWLSRVPSLEYLDLTGTDLHSENNWLQLVAMLPSLSDLTLRDCLLSSISPPLKYVNCTSLVKLDLSYNYLESVLPDWLCNLRNLKFLDLFDNQLNGSIPDCLSQLEHLILLELTQNLLSGVIPSSLGNLSSLTELGIGLNGLSGNLPESLGQLSKLEYLNARGNSFTGVLSETFFKGLSSLVTLVMDDSDFVFDLSPNWIPPFQLSDLYLRSCNLGPKFPPWIYTQRSLNTLDISNTGISPIEDRKFWNFVAGIGSYLNMSYNSISWDLSEVLLNTESVFLNSNNFKGGLPHISANVSILDLSHNSFQGSISPLLCQTSNKEINALRYLDISNNLLTGELLDCWDNWKSLAFIKFGNNRLTGELSPSLGSLHDLHLIDLHNNSFSGKLPLSLQNCKSLTLINLEGNKFSGYIPNWLQQSMAVLELKSNNFVGNIPSQLCRLYSLVLLDISDNKLSGPIPHCLYNMTALVEVDFKVPLEMAYGVADVHYPYNVMIYMKGLELEFINNLQFLRSFDLSSNNLSGEIPKELFKLFALKSLNLSRNHLMGNIPKNIGGMKNLESLDLSNNQLYGEIPQSISNLSFLSYLNLSNNNFSGQIPLGTQLQSFDAWSYSGNPQLCGAPLPKNCTKKEKPVEKEHEKSGTESWFYLGMGVGFAVGFWGVCGAIFLNRAFRHAYFRLVDHVVDRIYVAVALKFNMFH